MNRAISEADWKLLRKFQPIALERFCRRALEEIEQITNDADKTNHERYLAIYGLVGQRDGELAETFDDQRRSNAFFHLARFRLHELLTDKEMATFSDEAQAAVALFLECWEN
jgi:hypothetical protein